MLMQQWMTKPKSIVGTSGCTMWPTGDTNRTCAPRPQLAFPVRCITATAAVRFQNGATLKQRAVADLISVAFFFLLRVGEYTMPARNRQTRTVQFQCQDIRLWRFGQLLDHTAPMEHLLQADGVTLHIDNQKNGQ